MYETVLFDVNDDHVATITLNRSEAMNSFNIKMVDEFSHLWRRIADDDDIHAVVLRASPGRAFSTGADVKQAPGSFGHSNIWTEGDPGESLSPKANRCWKPVVTAVHGMCAGGAFYWLNESDIILCSEDATFFDPHVTYGMAAVLEPIGARWRMPLGDVLRMSLLGNDERICAQTALRIGLVTEVTKADALWNRATALATAIAAKPPAAVQGTVRAIWESLDLPRTAAIQTGLKYCQISNPVGTAQINRSSIMGKAKRYEIR